VKPNRRQQPGPAPTAVNCASAHAQIRRQVRRRAWQRGVRRAGAFWGDMSPVTAARRWFNRQTVQIRAAGEVITWCGVGRAASRAAWG
jgi:hypothetical protein